MRPAQATLLSLHGRKLNSRRHDAAAFEVPRAAIPLKSTSVNKSALDLAFQPRIHGALPRDQQRHYFAPQPHGITLPAVPSQAQMRLLLGAFLFLFSSRFSRHPKSPGNIGLCAISLVCCFSEPFLENQQWRHLYTLLLPKTRSPRLSYSKNPPAS
ncbi:hypothetical protein R3P38DRAFT_3188493 [Favolaschia claudopus]|uniref:Uncharacterized protein n=1 Tax=Favolaschia claudopus TaxID=2862362 RepID=A0AAW0BZX9_9AGAR